ncbi:MAG: hypothetical protein IJP82_06835 [Bacteroidaceae bacterium]|nr:hypothetical protein [Bacteroidaceae bacterium]
MKLPSIFNCSNDMALAAHVCQYQPPKRIQQMEADLALLARVWEDTRFAGPWGWSLATRQRYRQMGVAVEALPSDDWLEEVRRLSSREFACGYVKGLLVKLNDPRLVGEEMRWVDRQCFSWDVLATPEPTWGTSVNRRGARRSTDVGHVGLGVVRAPHARIFKSPWSSSGRGVFVSDALDEHTQKRLQGFLSSQGGFVVDRFYEDKVLDFAMEFFVHEDHQVEFLGYSVFETGEHGAYGYNYVESQEELLERIEDGDEGVNGVDRGLLERLLAYHQEHLGQTAYHGPVGIDMLKTSGSIHPCLEINFRMNMGILALLLHERYGAHATVALTPEREHGFQALVDDGRLMITFRP